MRLLPRDELDAHTIDARPLDLWRDLETEVFERILQARTCLESISPQQGAHDSCELALTKLLPRTYPRTSNPSGQIERLVALFFLTNCLDPSLGFPLSCIVSLL